MPVIRYVASVLLFYYRILRPMPCLMRMQFQDRPGLLCPRRLCTVRHALVKPNMIPDNIVAPEAPLAEAV